MRVLLTPLPVRSHFYNMVPLAWALRAAGHEVRVTMCPNMVDVVTGAGLTALPVGDEMDLVDQAAKTELGPLDGFPFDDDGNPALTLEQIDLFTSVDDDGPLEQLIRADDRYLDELVDVSRQWRPDLVVWDSMECSGPIVARALGAGHVRILVALDISGWLRTRYLADRATRPPEERADPLSDWLGRKLARFGATFDESMVLGQATIDPVSPWMRLPVDLDYLPMRFVPYNGRAVVPEWLREPPTKPRVCVTRGLTTRQLSAVDGPHPAQSDRGRTVLETLVRGAAALDVEVVATLSAEEAGAMGDLPPNVRVLDYVPLNELLPTCSAIIHHGSTTTQETATVNGVPQLIRPGTYWDESRRAQLHADRGAGLVLDRDGCTEDDVRRQVARLIEEPSFAANAARVRREVEESPSPHDLVPRLEELAAKAAANR
ncbi:activator-dependent family glycosyltransferase [Actinokineospora globicatena]|uniref:Glycosyl transferase n=1 Tax=Actinokineospora globicatena TaxID=103729 RepID=A0A9W6V8E0_9PSEU|nr:activator-dependent family glycosyltransferase [Actinokineospora globicatena]GLW89886.1 glycosyl transferase [Actinokineospora globicatena]